MPLLCRRREHNSESNKCQLITNSLFKQKPRYPEPSYNCGLCDSCMFLQLQCWHAFEITFLSPCPRMPASVTKYIKHNLDNSSNCITSTDIISFNNGVVTCTDQMFLLALDFEDGHLFWHCFAFSKHMHISENFHVNDNHSYHSRDQQTGGLIGLCDSYMQCVCAKCVAWSWGNVSLVRDIRLYFKVSHEDNCNPRW